MRDQVFTALGRGEGVDGVLSVLREHLVSEDLIRKVGLVESVDLSELVKMLSGEEYADLLAYLWLRTTSMQPREGMNPLREAIREHVSDWQALDALVEATESSQLTQESQDAESVLSRLLRTDVFRDTVRDQLCRAFVLRSLGWEIYRTGDFVGAIGAFEESLAVAKQHGFMTVLASLGVGACYWRSGWAATGLRILMDGELRNECERTRKYGLGVCLRNSVARAALVAKKFEISRHELTRAAEAIDKHEGIPVAYVAEYKHVLGLFEYCDGGDPIVAHNLVVEAHDMFESAGNLWGKADTMASLVEIQMAMPGSPIQELVGSIGEARAFSEEHGFLDLIPRIELIERALAS